MPEVPPVWGTAEGAGAEGHREGSVRREVHAEAGAERALEAAVRTLDSMPRSMGFRAGFKWENGQITRTGFMD